MRVTVTLREHDAKELLAKGPEHDHWPAYRALIELLEQQLGSSGRKASSAPRRWSVRDAPPKQRQPHPTGEVRQEVWRRAEGRCECGCRRRITWAGFEMDHFLGRGKWPESPETCWALTRECHRAKGAGSPDRLRWLVLFLAHLQRHGFAESVTAEKVRGEIVGAELIAKAAAIRARNAGVPRG